MGGSDRSVEAQAIRRATTQNIKWLQWHKSNKSDEIGNWRRRQKQKSSAANPLVDKSGWGAREFPEPRSRRGIHDSRSLEETAQVPPYLALATTNNHFPSHQHNINRLQDLVLHLTESFP
ncbi:MAG: hypothetical protein M2R45_04067 [Verrucomicrobia subdivision 3 bacterium]|nr:hypothetical protein [Limisphaerales bacterium]MCS1417006.1 hypothetical protein [Limisphaerales bacterium]